MGLKMIHTALLLTAIFTLGTSQIHEGAKPLCHQFETFSECGKACEETCSNVFLTGKRCPAVCAPGCVCNPGYLRDPETDRCVRLQQCPRSLNCGPFEVLSECASLCQPRCGGPAKSSCSRSPCQEACVCKPGYIREERGNKCIPKQRCGSHKVCGEFEVYNSCGTACEKTCNNWHIDTKCTFQCVSGCFCVEGTVRDPLTHKCIPINECSNVPKCGKNQVFKRGGVDCATCDNYKFVDCVFEEIPKCYCIDGFVRNRQDECIHPQTCPIID